MDSSSSGRTRLPYTRRDDKLIVKYFLATKDVGLLGGNECWKRLEKSEQYNPSKRSWQSLKERFRKSIKPYLRRFDLSAAQLELFDAGQSANGKSDQRRRMLTATALDSSSEEISDQDEDAEPGDAKSKKTDAPRAGAASRPARNSLTKRSTLEKPAVDSPRPSTSSREDGGRDLNRSRSFSKRRNFYHESSPLLPEVELFSESPKRYMRLNHSENRSASPVSPSPRRNNTPEKKSQEIVPARRKVRFQNESPVEEGGSSPVIETASIENLDGVMFGALIPAQTDASIASRTRSSCRSNGAIESPDDSPVESSQVELQKRFQKRPRAAVLCDRTIKQEQDDGSHGVLALPKPDSSARTSTQDLLRNAISDTQSDESFHSTFQSPLRLGSQENGWSSPSKSQKRKNHESRTVMEGGDTAKKIRSDSTTSNTHDAVHSSTTRQGLVFRMNVRLRFPEPPRIRDEALIAFVELIKSTFRKHTSWGPHGNCPGLHELLYLCKMLRERVLRARSSSSQRERDALLVDHHLYDLFDVPFCSRNRKNSCIDSKGVHRHLLDSDDWLSFLDDLNSVYEARELLKTLDLPDSDVGIEGDP